MKGLTPIDQLHLAEARLAKQTRDRSPPCHLCGHTPATEPWGPCEEFLVCTECAYLHQGPERDV